MKQKIQFKKNSSLFYSPVILLLGIVLSIHCFGQREKLFSAVISGKVLYDSLRVNDSINVVIHEEGFGFPEKRMVIPVKEDQTFEVVLAFPNKLAIVRMSMKGHKRVFMLNKIIEPNDHIQMELKATSQAAVAKYYGTSAVKYEYEDSLKNLFEQYYKRFLDHTIVNDINKAGEIGHFENPQWAANLEDFFRMSLKAYNNNFTFIKQIEDKISKEASSYFKGTYTAKYTQNWKYILCFAHQRLKNDKEKEQIKEAFQKHVYPDYLSGTDEESLSLNIDYLFWLDFYNAKIDLYFSSKDSSFTFDAIFNKLSNSSSGILKERLLTYFLTSGSSPKGFFVNNLTPLENDKAVTKAVEIVKNPALSRLLSAQKVHKEGSEVLDFTMPDTKGKMFSLKDFRGKVVLIDAWGVGCTGCANFFARFEGEISKKIEHSNFQKIFINTDRTRERWLSGVNSGIYTSKDYLNLYAEGMDIEHPFLKYYNVNAVPFLLLVDKQGNLVTTLLNQMSSDDIVKLINQECDK